MKVRSAIDAGIGYLAERQRQDGRWEDFDLPVGKSDAWVTAYIGLALVDAGRSLSSAQAQESAAHAGSWLAEVRPYAAGWGYNSITGPDTDSTAYALCLLRELARPSSPEDEQWLQDRWVPGCGFATYDRRDNWGLAHPDVTPVAFRALPADSRARLKPGIIECLHRCREEDGTWPAYWWRTRHYSSYSNASLLRDLDCQAELPRPVVSAEDSRGVHSAFDLCYVLANVWLAFHGCIGTQAVIEELLHLQRGDGSWPGAPILRVARHDAKEPWLHPEGDLFADVDHLFTTASAVRVLAMTAAS